MEESGNKLLLKDIITYAVADENHPLHNASNLQDFKKAFASIESNNPNSPQYGENVALLQRQVAEVSQKELLELVLTSSHIIIILIKKAELSMISERVLSVLRI